MSVDDSRRETWAKMQADAAASRNPATPDEKADALQHGGGGGTSGGMEGRVAKLEAHVETLRTDMAVVKKDVSDIRVSIGKIETEIKHLPGKWFTVTVTMAGLAILTAIVLYGEKLKALLGLG